MKKYFKYFSYLFLVLSNILLLFFLFMYKRTISLSYPEIILFYIFMTFLVFFTGIIINENKTYKINIKIYIILYLICLLSVTIFDRAIIDSTSPVNQLMTGNFILFHSINRYFKTMYLPLFLRNIVDNMLCLIPLSFLLIMLNDKYKSLKKQLPILLIVDIGIEVLQGLTGCGIFDVDDILLNVGFALIFTFIFNKIVIKIKPIFYKDIIKNNIIKYILLIISTLLVLAFDISLIVTTNYNFGKKNDISFSYNYSDVDGVTTTKTDNFDLYEINIEVTYKRDEQFYNLDEALSKYGTTIFDKFTIEDSNGTNMLILHNDILQVYELDNGNNINIYVAPINIDVNKYLN